VAAHTSTGFVDDPNTICNMNAVGCEEPTDCGNDLNNDGNIDDSEACPDGYCLVSDFDGDGADDDTFCRNPSTACDSMDFNNNGNIDKETCDHNIERCLGIDDDLDGIVDRQDCDIDEDCHTYMPSYEFFEHVSQNFTFTDCRPEPHNDCLGIDADGMGGVFGVEFYYCLDFCGQIRIDVDGDGLASSLVTGADPSGCTECGTDSNGDGVIDEVKSCGDDCYLYDADGDGAEDDHFCQDPTTLCYNIDIDADAIIEETGCDNSSGECQPIDADQDGLSDDLFCQDPTNDCYVLDIDSDGVIDNSNCGGEPGEDCIGVDSDGDGSVDIFDCSNVNGCIGVDFDGDGILDAFACDPNGD
jgi:hypothetical protein